MPQDRYVRALARELAVMQRRLANMEVASQADLRSIEGGTLDVYDDDGNLVGMVGVQKDGTVGMDVRSTAKPEAPTEPDVQPIPGGAIVAWDGQFEDDQPRKNIERVAVHMDEGPGFAPSSDTEVAAITARGEGGGTAVIPLDDGADWYVKFVAVSTGGVESDPSTEVLVEAMDAETVFMQDEFVIDTPGQTTVRLTYEPTDFSEHLYWNGVYQREDVAWTRIGRVVTLTNTPTPVRVGDRVEVEYAYRPAPLDTVQPTLADSVGVGLTGGSETTTLPLPPGARVGDLIVVTGTTGSGGTAVMECDDPDLVEVWRTPRDGSTRFRSIWCGTVTDPAAPIPVRMRAQQGSVYGQFGYATVAVFRGAGGDDLEWDLGRVAEAEGSARAGSFPALEGGGSGGVVVGFAHYGIGGVGGDGEDWSMVAPYQKVVRHAHSYTLTEHGVVYTPQQEPIPATAGTPYNTGWRAVVIGLA